MNAWILFTVILVLAGSCHTVQHAKRKDFEKVETPDIRFDAGPPTLVYKTKANYDSLVPVLLSEDGSEIVAYPHPSDIRMPAGEKPGLKSGHPYPIPLENGYLLDQRGIGPNVAFLDITYADYGALKETPTLKELMALILDKDPLTELCDCGNRHAFKDTERQLNKLIVFGHLRKVCQVLK